jgi:hypothetical protein
MGHSAAFTPAQIGGRQCFLSLVFALMLLSNTPKHTLASACWGKLDFLTSSTISHLIFGTGRLQSSLMPHFLKCFPKGPHTHPSSRQRLALVWQSGHLFGQSLAL